MISIQSYHRQVLSVKIFVESGSHILTRLKGRMALANRRPFAETSS
jgi:hypothetical protein